MVFPSQTGQWARAALARLAPSHIWLCCLSTFPLSFGTLSRCLTSLTAGVDCLWESRPFRENESTSFYKLKKYVTRDNPMGTCPGRVGDLIFGARHWVGLWHSVGTVIRGWWWAHGPRESGAADFRLMIIRTGNWTTRSYKKFILQRKMFLICSRVGPFLEKDLGPFFPVIKVWSSVGWCWEALRSDLTHRGVMSSVQTLKAHFCLWTHRNNNIPHSPCAYVAHTGLSPWYI